MAEPAAGPRRWLIHAARVALGGAVLAWILATTQWHDATDHATGAVTTGLRSALGGADWAGLAVALAAFGGATLAGTVRFWALLRVQGSALSLWLSFQITYVGLFFNLALPGHNGGDLVKIAWTARATGAMSSGLAVTAVDRVIGLLALSLLALVPTLLVLGDPAYRRVAIVCIVVLVAGFGTIGLYLTPAVRRLFERGHGSARRVVRALVALDGAVAGYRREPRAIAIATACSLLGHVGIIATLWGLGWALGLPPVNYFVVAPAVAIAAAIPLTPGGAGQAEAALLYFMPVPESERPKVVALGICYRFCILLYGCLGGVVLAFARGGAPAPAPPVDTAGDAPDSAAP